MCLEVIVQKKASRFFLVVAVVATTLVGVGINFVGVGAATLNQHQISTKASMWIDQHQSTLGISSHNLVTQRVIATRDGLATVRFGQVISGVPVLDSLVAVTLKTDGTFVSQTHTLSALTAASKPHLTSALAQQKIVLAFAKKIHTSPRNIIIREVKHVLVDPKITRNKQKLPSILWRATATNRKDILSSSAVYLSDSTGKLVSTVSLVENVTQPTYPSPLICDLQSSQPSSHFASEVSSGRVGGVQRKWVGQLSSYPLCEKSDPGRISNSSTAVKSVQETVSYYWNKLGVDIAAEQYLGNISPLANFGKNVSAKTYCDTNPADASCAAVISGFTNVCNYDSSSRSVECPMQNAYWVPWNSTDCHSGACSGIFFGAGYDVADDVVSHELTHGVTGGDSFSSGVCSSCDAGAISEALSDFFGEAVDLLNPSPNKTADPNWQMGEAISGGPFRNMAMTGATSPCATANGWVPIKQIDSTWNSTCDSHTNLGPADRFAWLISNGGTQNGIKVSPIGNAPWSSTGAYEACHADGDNCTAIVNMTRLAFQTLAKITANTSYSQFGTQLTAACNDLMQAKSNPFPASYCLQVKKALAATGISSLNLAFTTKPVTSKLRTAVTVAGKLTATNAVVASGVPLILQFRSITSSTWSTLSTMTTSNIGTVSASVKFPSTGSYRLATVSNSSIGKYLSPSVTVTVSLSAKALAMKKKK